MAFVGMRYVVWAPLEEETDGQAPVYGQGMVVGAGVSATVNIERNSEGQYGDDVLQESDNSIISMTIDLSVTDMEDEVGAAILGLVKGEGTNEYLETDAQSPYGGLGYIRVRSRKGKTYFQARWIYKVQLGEPTETSQTKERSISWQNVSLSGNAMAVKPNANLVNVFRKKETFATEKEAVDWLNALANISGAAAASDAGFDDEA